MTERKAKRVLFLGDSTTDCGRLREDPWALGEGFVKFFVQQWNHIAQVKDEDHEPVLFMNRGIGGDRTKDVIQRFETDVTAEAPDVVFLLIGINDIWRAIDQHDPTDEDTLRDQLSQIVQSIKELPTTPKLVMMEPFLLPNATEYEAFRRLLNPYLTIVRSIASQSADLFIPLDGLLNARAVNGPGQDALSGDGVHLTDEGNETIADFITHYLLEESNGTIL